MQLEETLDVLVNRHFPEKKLKKNLEFDAENRYLALQKNILDFMNV